MGPLGSTQNARMLLTAGMTETSPEVSEKSSGKREGYGLQAGASLAYLVLVPATLPRMTCHASDGICQPRAHPTH